MFQNKIVIITGASSSVGQTTSIQFAKQGASIVIVGSDEAKLTNVKQLCDAVGPPAYIIKADITADEEARRVITETINKYHKLDVLVNVADVVRQGMLVDASILQSYDEVMKTNVRAAVNLTSFATKYLIASKGNIVNVSFVGGNRVVSPGYTAYCIASAALNHFTRTAAAELGKDGVRVNSVSPGTANSEDVNERTAQKTLLSTLPDFDEIAGLVLYVASDDAKSVTGSNFACDSGILVNT